MEEKNAPGLFFLEYNVIHGNLSEDNCDKLSMGRQHMLAHSGYGRFGRHRQPLNGAQTPNGASTIKPQSSHLKSQAKSCQNYTHFLGSVPIGKSDIYYMNDMNKASTKRHTKFFSLCPAPPSAVAPDNHGHPLRV